MKQAFPSPRRQVVARGDLPELVSELIDAHADTVRLIVGEQRAELQWLAHCDYLRALQRLGHETLARRNQRMSAPPLALAVGSGLTAALTRGRAAALLIFRSPSRAAQALHHPNRPTVSARSRVSS